MTHAFTNKRHLTQLQCIESTVRRLLAKQLLPHQPLDKHSETSARADTTTDNLEAMQGHLAGRGPAVSLCLDSRHHLLIAPLLGGSLACNELLINTDDGFPGNSAFKPRIVSGNDAPPLDSAFFHTRFSPLEKKLAKLLGTQPTRVLIMTSTADSGGIRDELCKASQLLSTLQLDPKGLSVLVVGNEADSDITGQYALKQLRKHLPLLSCVAYTQLDQNDSYTRFSLLGKCSFVISGSQAIVHDALLAQTPVVCWNGPLISVADDINDVLSRATDKVLKTDLGTIAEQQRRLWWSCLTSDAKTSVMNNKQRDLSQLIEYWLTWHQANTDTHLAVRGSIDFASLLTPASDADITPIVLSNDTVMPLTLLDPGANSQIKQMKSSLSSARRKLSKFRQSPRRFVEDSQHPLLSSLKRQRP